MLVSACLVEPADELVAPISGDSYRTVLSLIPGALAVLRFVAHVESDPADVMRWDRQSTIVWLERLTAAEPASMGRSERVIDFLRSVREGRRE